MADTTQEFRGKVGAMSEDEMETFLGRGVCARVACLDLEGNPYVTVVWHEWRDGAFWFVGRQRAAWCEFMKKDARVSIVVDVPDTLEKVFCGARARGRRGAQRWWRLGRCGRADGCALPRTRRPDLPDPDPQAAALADQGDAD